MANMPRMPRSIGADSPGDCEPMPSQMHMRQQISRPGAKRNQDELACAVNHTEPGQGRVRYAVNCLFETVKYLDHSLARLDENAARLLGPAPEQLSPGQDPSEPSDLGDLDHAIECVQQRAEHLSRITDRIANL